MPTLYSFFWSGEIPPDKRITGSTCRCLWGFSIEAPDLESALREGLPQIPPGPPSIHLYSGTGPTTRLELRATHTELAELVRSPTEGC